MTRFLKIAALAIMALPMTAAGPVLNRVEAVVLGIAQDDAHIGRYLGLPDIDWDRKEARRLLDKGFGIAAEGQRVPL
jgi:hypothetical protein